MGILYAQNHNCGNFGQINTSVILLWNRFICYLNQEAIRVVKI